MTELAAYSQHFDVCLMPYAMTDYTKYICPLKMSEYPASGMPIVSSPAAGSDAIRKAYFHLLRTNCLDSITASLGMDGAEKRQEAARAYDWAIIVKRVTDILEDKGESQGYSESLGT